jgi:hypothetical protein
MTQSEVIEKALSHGTNHKSLMVSENIFELKRTIGKHKNTLAESLKEISK